MRFKGKLKDISRDWKSNIPTLTLTVEEGNLNEIIDLQQSDLSVEVKRWTGKKKRSLDANAYLWVLCSKMADLLKSSKEEIYEELLQKYGFFYEDSDGYVVITVKNSVNMSQVPGHWRYYKSNGKFKSYLMIKGTSEYDTTEMSHFIDRVVEDAKDLGIETMTPDELERMKHEWKNQF